MLRALLVVLALFGALPSLALAQSYQDSNDGLVAVHVKKVLHADQSVAFDVCAQLLRQEKMGPLEVRLNYWKASGGMLAQASSVLRPASDAPVCQRILLPARARGYERWEISRLRFLPNPTPLTAARPAQKG
jgi:hypothetical protein